MKNAIFSILVGVFFWGGAGGAVGALNTRLLPKDNRFPAHNFAAVYPICQLCDLGLRCQIINTNLIKQYPQP